MNLFYKKKKTIYAEKFQINANISDTRYKLSFAWGKVVNQVSI